MEKTTPYAPNNQTELPLAHYREQFAAADPQEIALRTGAVLQGNKLTLSVLKDKLEIDWPDFSAEGWPDYHRILFLHYLLAGRAVSPCTGFKSYRDLPWGEVYDRNFNGRCVLRLARTFGTKPEQFRAACEALGGMPVQSSGIGYDLEFMKNLHLRFFLWEGDDEFAPTAQILFSENFQDAFAAEDRVVVCEYVIGKMKAALA